MSDAPVMHWFRRDLRLSDNTALRAALKTKQPVIPLFILDPALIKGERFSASRLAFLLEGLQALDSSLKDHGTRLLVKRGKPEKILRELVRDSGAVAVYANRDYTPYARQRDDAVTDALDVELHWFDDLVIHEPESVLKDNNHPYTVFTPFKNKWLNLPKPDAEGGVIHGRRFHDLRGLDNDGIPSLKTLKITEKVVDLPPASEHAAKARLQAFAGNAIYDYAKKRDTLIATPFADPVPDGTSYLSPYLRMGMLSPRQAYAAAVAARKQTDDDRDARASVDVWINELAWRDFYHQILWHFPHVHATSFQAQYERVEFRSDKDDLQRWKNGETGYPVIDAAMRQLNQIGWMHNRARMIVASFLTKDLLIYWSEGEKYFMQKLIDGDIAANNGGWQWSAGTGTDAQPFFRIFNPVSQSQRYDPHGDYIRHFVPELRGLSDKQIHEPWKLSHPPKNYPPPMVDHGMARERTLQAFQAARNDKSE